MDHSSGRLEGDSSIPLDVLHASATDEACAIDRARADGGERSWIRPGIRHELCAVLDRCLTGWPVFVKVIVLEDGLRIRMPIAPAELAQ